MTHALLEPICVHCRMQPAPLLTGLAQVMCFEMARMSCWARRWMSAGTCCGSGLRRWAGARCPRRMRTCGAPPSQVNEHALRCALPFLLGQSALPS